MTPSDIKALAASLGGQNKLATRLGVDPSRVSNWINGHRKPSPMAVKLLTIIQNEVIQ